MFALSGFCFCCYRGSPESHKGMGAWHLEEASPRRGACAGTSPGSDLWGLPPPTLSAPVKASRPPSRARQEAGGTRGDRRVAAPRPPDGSLAAGSSTQGWPQRCRESSMGQRALQEDSPALCAKWLVPIGWHWPCCVWDPAPDPNTDQSRDSQAHRQKGCLAAAYRSAQAMVTNGTRTTGIHHPTDLEAEPRDRKMWAWLTLASFLPVSSRHLCHLLSTTRLFLGPGFSFFVGTPVRLP